MNSKERVLAAYQCREVDRIPVINSVNPYDDSHWIQKEPSYREFLEIAKKADVTGGWSPNISIHSLLKGVEIDGKTFTREFVQAEDGHYGKMTKFPIENEDDLDCLLKYDDFRIPREVDFSQYRKVKKAVGEKGIVAIWIPDFIDFLGENIVEEEFSILSFTALDKMEELLKKISGEYKEFLKYILENVVDDDYTIVYFYGPEFAIPPLVGPEVFDRLYKYNQPLIDLIHSYDALVHVHSHGKVKNYISKFMESGVDILNPIEPPPMGDVTATEALKITNGKMALQGGIEFGDIELLLTPKEVKEKTQALLEEVKATKTNGFLLGMTANVVKNTLEETTFNNYKAFIETALAFK